MREFGAVVSVELAARIRREALALFELMPGKQPVLGEALAMDETDLLVLEVAEVLDENGNKFKLSVTRPQARPPFEWLIEISSDLGESEYFKHYLVREEDIVLAQRKVLTPIDEAEADIILADLAEARGLVLALSDID
jgi:hypothetical protein